MTDYDARLDNELQALLKTQRTAALGTLAADGAPHVTLANFALAPAAGRLVLQLGAASAPVEHLRRDPRLSLMVRAAALDPSSTDDATRARATLAGTASFPEPGSPEWQACRIAWLARYPESEAMSSMLDLVLVGVAVREVRHVSDFGAARSLGAAAIEPLLRA